MCVSLERNCELPPGWRGGNFSERNNKQNYLCNNHWQIKLYQAFVENEAIYFKDEFKILNEYIGQ